MKLKDAYVSYQAREGEKLLVATGSEAEKFKGLMRANEAAGFIIDCLAEETDEAQILEKLKAEYDAPEDVLSSDLKEILDKLRDVGALDE